MQARLNSRRRRVNLLVVAVAVIAALVCPHPDRHGPGECLIRGDAHVATTGITAAIQSGGQMRGTGRDPGWALHERQHLARVPIDALVSSLIVELDVAPQEPLSVQAFRMPRTESKLVGYGSPPGLAEICWASKHQNP